MKNIKNIIAVTLPTIALLLLSFAFLLIPKNETRAKYLYNNLIGIDASGALSLTSTADNNFVLDNSTTSADGDSPYLIFRGNDYYDATAGNVELDMGIRLNIEATDDYEIEFVNDGQSAVKATLDETGNLYIKGALNYGPDAAASDTYDVTCDPVYTAYVNGMIVTFQANTANTGACTLNVNGIGAKSITMGGSDERDLTSDTIEAGMMVLVIYDSSNDVFQIPNLNNIL